MVTTFVEEKKSPLHVPNSIVDLQNMKEKEADLAYDQRYEEYRKTIDANYVELMSQPTRSQIQEKRNKEQYNLLFSNVNTETDTPEKIRKEIQDLQRRLERLEK